MTIFILTSCINDASIKIYPSKDEKDNVAGINNYNKLEVGNFSNVSVYCYKKIIDPINDLDDWYNSSSLLMLRDNISNNKYESYYFSSSVKYDQHNDKKVADLLILSIFEVEDIRLERHIVIFNNDDVEIIIIKYIGRFSKINKKLYDQQYLIYRDNSLKSSHGLIWDYKHNKREQLSIEIREGRTNISEIKLWYKNTEEIKEKLIK